MAIMSPSQPKPEGRPLPCCGYLVDAYQGLSDPSAEPAQGDLSVCINCGALLLFTDDDYGVRQFTPAEFEQLPFRAQSAYQEMRRFILKRGPLA